jgi:hypothetical protein
MCCIWLSSALAVTTVDAAEQPATARSILSIAKMAGACGSYRSMVDLQTSTNIPGGTDFVTRFMNVEAARLGVSTVELLEQCVKASQMYDQLVEAADAESTR